jgi:FkbM family methyltransferase
MKGKNRKATGGSERPVPLMSIVIPTKNSARTLGACLESLKNQTVKDFEIIIVDDSSEDGTKELAEAYGARYMVSNSTPPGARNSGFSSATGSVFISIDSDMILEEGLLEEIAKKMAGPEEYDALILTEVGYGDDYISRCKDLEKRCYIGDGLVEAARAFRRTMFEASGGYDPALFFGEDWDLFMRLKKECRKIGRTQAKLMHNECLSIPAYIRKAYKYGTSFSKYARKNRIHALTIFSPRRSFFFRHSGKLVREPLHAIGLVLMKCMEYSAGFAGFIGSGISGNGFLKNYSQALRIISAIENWHEYAGCAFGLQPSTDRIRLRNGLEVKIRPLDGDIWVISEVFARKAYTPPGFHIGEEEIVVDIGAHIGAFTLLAASQARKGHIFSYEPFPESYALLQENIVINDFHNIETRMLGVSGRRCKKRLNIFKGRSSCNSIYKEGPDSLEMECITLADIFRENRLDRCGFLKIDCEGAEYGILMGSDPSTLARIDRIALEYHDSFVGFKSGLGKDENHFALKAFLEKNGFTVKVKPPMMYAIRQGGSAVSRLLQG